MPPHITYPWHVIQLNLPTTITKLSKLISWAHATPATGHPGTQRTYGLVRVMYWWPNMVTDVNRYISSCTSCAQAKMYYTLPTSKLLPLSKPQCPMSHIAINFLIDLSKSMGNTMIIIFQNLCALSPCLVSQLHLRKQSSS